MSGETKSDKLKPSLSKLLGDLGRAFSAPVARIGFRLGLVDKLHRRGAATVSEAAARCGRTDRYVRGCALTQVANPCVNYEATHGRFSLSREQLSATRRHRSVQYLLKASK